MTYSWVNPDANAYSVYQFGASFPLQYVPESAIVKPGFLELGIGSRRPVRIYHVLRIHRRFFGAGLGLSARRRNKRKLQYLPPKISIEGHGIKRGLTAVEAAILMEQPLDKILTMILFAVIKKDAATVTTRDPLELEITVVQNPEGLHPYENRLPGRFQRSKSFSQDKDSCRI